jgi:hypothetical protein
MAASTLNKRTLIDKSNSTIVGVMAVAAFVSIFCLIASKSLISQEQFQGRVIGKKKIALSTLKQDISATHSLVSSYEAFASTPTNVIGGNPTGSGPQDGDNAKIVLDALPSTYDFPALTTSLGVLISNEGLKIDGITGTDDEIAQQSNQASGSPSPVPMPFTINVDGPYAQIQALILEFQNSIRPFQIQTIAFSGDQSDLTASITAQTYYQPEKALSITEEPVQ